jgi:phage gpG-like protein
MLTVKLVGADGYIARLNAMPAAVRQALIKKVTALSFKLESKIKAEKLSGQVLHVKSGALRDSIHALPVVASDTSVTGGAVQGSPLTKAYAAIHEYGGKTAAHEIIATKAQALSFAMGGKQMFFKKVMHPGSVMPERSYMRSSLAEMKEEIIEGMHEAVREALLKK